MSTYVIFFSIREMHLQCLQLAAKTWNTLQSNLIKHIIKITTNISMNKLTFTDLNQKMS